MCRKFVKNLMKLRKISGRKQGVFGQNVPKKIQFLAVGWGGSDPVGVFRVLLFKICSFTGLFLVGFEILHCENRLTLDIVCD